MRNSLLETRGSLLFVAMILMLINFSNTARAQYAPIPYYTGFESGSLDANWELVSSDPLGRTQIWNDAVFVAASPVSDNFFFGMDTQPPGGVFTTNEAWIKLNLSGESNVKFNCWWMEWNDETQPEDGIYLSDNGGSSFTKVLDLDGGATVDLTWNQIVLNISDLANSNGLTLTNTFVIKLQQHDNFYFDGGNDGFFFDNISVTSSSCSLTGPNVSDVDLCGPGIATLAANGEGLTNWYATSGSINPIATGNTFNTPQLETSSTYFAATATTINQNWDFSSSLQGWAALAECGLGTTTWNYTSDGGNGSAYAQDLPGNSSQLLISPLIDVSGITSVDFNFQHRFNTETCCDHGYVVYRTDGGPWQKFTPTTGAYNIFDFMYNDPILGACGFSADIDVFAGDNGGYQLSGGLIDVLNASYLELGFLFTTDASFGDDGWYISSVDLELNCESPRDIVSVNVLPVQEGPSVSDASVCGNESAILIANSNTANPNPEFDWFNIPDGGSPFFTGQNLNASPVQTTTYWVEEQAGGIQVDSKWTFDSDQEGWSLLTQCGLTDNWNWNSDGGAGTLFASNPGAGNSSMLAVSPGISVNGIDEVSLTFKHRYNTETCCDHGYVVYRINGGAWQVFQPTSGDYNIYDFMYNDPILGGCGFSPDTNVYAGDSDGYITSSGPIDVSSGAGLQVGFLFTSDASFTDEGWYLDQVRVVSTTNCPSERVPATIYVNEAPSAPLASDLDICPGASATLSATSSAGTIDPVFEWYNASVNGDLLYRGNPYISNPPGPTTVYVQELSQSTRTWGFDSDLEGWSATSECGIPGNWEWVDDAGEPAIFAQQMGSGNSSMLLTSPLIQVDGSELINFSFEHRFNTETCCDHGYVVYRLDGGDWQFFTPTTNPYNIYDFMYNDPFLGDCGFSPDTTVFAGDSGGYLTSSGQIDATGASTMEVVFFYSSDASFVDEGWYINNVTLEGISQPDCASPRTTVQINTPTLGAPTTTGDEVCPPQPGTLSATTTSGTVDPVFEWYTASVGGEPVFTGNPFIPNPTPVSTTTYYAQEIIEGEYKWDFEDDLLGWQAIANCGLTSNWVIKDDNGTSSAFARQTGSGNSSMTLLSPVIDVSGEQEDVTLKYTHRYNTETCCDHGYVIYRLDGGAWQFFEPETGGYNIYDFMYNDPYFGGCGFSPDTNVYAGESNGYINSAGSIDAGGAATLQVAFFYSSDASFVDDGWYIDKVEISDVVTSCVSDRSPVTLTTTGQIDPPSAENITVCPGLEANLEAISNSGLEDITFSWYDDPNAGNLLSTGPVYTVNPGVTTTYYVDETTGGDAVWTFDEGLDNWTATAECGLTSNWAWSDDGGAGAMFAQQQGSGNSSMLLRSPVMPLSGQTIINYAFNHRFNTETCCDHGYVVARRDGGAWFQVTPTTNPYNIFDFMYNDPILGNCGFSPDINVFAGDSGGYLTSSGSLSVGGNSTVQFGFLYTSDASFVDEGWYINDFRIESLYPGCSSDRTPVTVFVEDLAAPTVSNDVTCIGGSGTLMATSNSNVLNTTFEWFDAAVGGNLVGSGDVFLTPPVNVNTSYWAQEVVQSPLSISDNFDGGADGSIWASIQAGNADQICGSVSGDALRFDGLGTRIAWINPVDVAMGGNITFDLKISQEITAGCEAAEPGEDVVLEYSIGGPYTIMTTFNENNYPDFTSINLEIPPGAQSPNTIFRLRQLSNSGAGFDVWAIDNFAISGLGLNTCQSPRTEGQVTVEPLTSPSATDDNICPGEKAILTATSNSGFPNPVFEWYADFAGGLPLDIGESFHPSPVVNTTYFVQERNRGDRFWTFNNDLEDWIITAECGLTEIWQWQNDGGAGSLFANNPTGGNTSMLAQSPGVNVAGANAIDLSFNHRFNTETCCDHGYVVYRLDGGEWQIFTPTINAYNIFDFMYNDPINGACGFSPDMNVFAGDNGGYNTSSGEIDVTGAEELEVAFLYTSDASFVDEGWFINSVSVTGLGGGCVSERIPANVTISDPSAPESFTVDICTGGTAILEAVATSGNIDPDFEWYDAQNGGTLIFEGNPLNTPQLFTNTSYWVQEVVIPDPYTLSDNFNSGPDPAIWASVQAGVSDAICGAVSVNALRFNGAGTRVASTNQVNVGNGGNLNFFLKISQDITAGCESAEPGEDVVLEYSVGGPYTIISTYDQDGYGTFTEINEEIPVGAYSPNTIFRLRQLANSGLDFDVWAIDNFTINGNPGVLCNSARSEIPVNVTPLEGPTVSDVEICGGETVFLSATSNSGIPNPQVEWYDVPAGGEPIFIGNPFEVTPAGSETYYVQEVDPYGGSWTFDSNSEDWTLSPQCGLTDNWQWDSDGGEGALFATNPTGGNTSMLAISPAVEVTDASEVFFSYNHRYNTETCCDHGYVVYRLDGGDWVVFQPTAGGYNIYDFMYNDPILGGCGFSPDTLVYAGDSGGYITSSGSIQTGSAISLEVGFLFTSDASFMDDGWYINSVNLTMAGSGCVSERVAVNILVDETAPEITCPALISVNAPPDACGAIVEFMAEATDDCGFIISYSQEPGTEFPVGNSVVIATATDDANNSADCEIEIQVNDLENPIALCMDITVMLDNVGSASILAGDIDNGSNDACGVGSLSIDQSDFICDEIGNNNVVLTVTDNNSNSSQCVAVVDVQDNLPPVAICNDLTIALEEGGIHIVDQAELLSATVGSSDNCAISNLSIDLGGTYTCDDLGDIPITIIISDASGNEASCNVVLTVDDPFSNCNQPPVAVCQDITVSAGPICLAIIAGQDVDGGSSDPDGDVLTYSINPPGPFFPGVTNVILTVTDPSDESDQCLATVTVVDDVPPVAICQPAIVQLDIDGNGSLTAIEVDGGSFDACGFVSLTLNNKTFNCDDVGNNMVVLTATDNAGNSSTCNATVVVEDNIPPTAICQDLTVQLDEFGNAIVVAQDLDNGSIDACGISDIEINDVEILEFDCTNIGNNAVSMTITDNNGNSSLCDVIILVEDNVDPVALCKDIDLVLSETGTATIAAPDVDNGSSDACGVDFLSVSINNFSCADIGPNDVVLTVTDANNNMSTCIAIVNVLDNDIPVLECPESFTVNVDAETCGALIDESQMSPLQVMDNCETTLAYELQGNPSGSAIPYAISGEGNVPTTEILTGNAVITYTLTDASGNSTDCDFAITAVDNQPPVITCPADIVVDTDLDQCHAVVNYSVSSSDNCHDLSAVSITAGLPSGSDFQPGTTVNTFMVTDLGGNTSTCSFSITVEDNQDPYAICQDVTIELNASGMAGITAGDIDNGSNDACGIGSLTVSMTDFGCADIGTNNVELTVTDVNTNSSNCNAVVTVNGVIPVVTISQDELPVFCQGGTLVLTANSDQAITYLWSTGEMTSEIQVNSDGVYSVTVTSSTNCTATESITITGFDSGALLSSYSILAISGDVDLRQHNQVSSGGVGVVNPAGEISLRQSTHVNTFAQSVNVVIDGSSSASNIIPSPANPILPPFVSNPYNSNNDVKINAGSTVTLTDCIYGKIDIKKNSTVTFNCDNIFIEELKLGNNVTIVFAGSANLFINKKVKTGNYNSINGTGNTVTFYIDNDVDVRQGSTMNANIYSTGKLSASGNINAPTSMTGLFIAQSIIGKNYVNWNWDTHCDPAGLPVLPPFVRIDPNVESAISARGKIQAIAYPNPFFDRVIIEFEIPDDRRTSVEILNIIGETIEQYDLGMLEKERKHYYEFHADQKLSAGPYIYRIISGEYIITGRVIHLK